MQYSQTHSKGLCWAVKWSLLEPVPLSIQTPSLQLLLLQSLDPLQTWEPAQTKSTAIEKTSTIMNLHVAQFKYHVKLVTICTWLKKPYTPELRCSLQGLLFLRSHVYPLSLCPGISHPVCPQPLNQLEKDLKPGGKEIKSIKIHFQE